MKLVDYYYKKYEHTPVNAINHAIVRIRGSYALALMFKDYPGEIYAARKDSPMILGITGGETYLASDVPAILKYTRNGHCFIKKQLVSLQCIMIIVQTHMKLLIHVSCLSDILDISNITKCFLKYI